MFSKSVMNTKFFNKVCPYFIALSLTVLLVLLADPFGWMPPMGAMIALLAATIFLILFAGFVMQENGGDEREVVHRMNAGRIAYLSGIGTLTIGLIMQGFAHAIDPWILAALGVMVLAKIVSRFYSDTYQ